MPSVTANKRFWDELYTWPEEGDEWSVPWGSAKTQWERVLLPRIETFVRAETIVELGPGFGRWTQFLKNYCSRLIVVDISPKCISHCKERFIEDSHITYYVNDGMSLSMIDGGSVDFVFSFDSLVHAEADVLESYAISIARILKRTGCAFIHHSNLRECAALKGREAYKQNGHWRSKTMSAQLMQLFCRQADLFCSRQELVNWMNAGHLTDCFSTILRQQSSLRVGCEVISNMDFMSRVERGQ